MDPSREIRSSVLGCVENRDAIVVLLRGLTMNICAVDGLTLVLTAPFAESSFPRALASDWGLPLILAPPASAPNSLPLEIASYIMVAAIGARKAIARMPRRFPPSSSFPPKIKDHWAMLARNVITPAIVAAIVLINVSLFLMWASS